MSLNMCAPSECRDMTGVIGKKWKRMREKYLQPEIVEGVEPETQTNDLSLQSQENDG